MKRIALVVMSRHITSLGGIGFFTASFVKLVHNKDFIVDLIVDRPIRYEDIRFEELRTCNIICPKESLSYSYDSRQSFFMKEKTPIELFANFQRVIIESAEHHVYDFIFINSVEATPGILHSNMNRLVHTACYTHYAPFFDEYPQNLNEFGAIMDISKSVDFITQSSLTKFDWIENIDYIPMPSLESELLRNTQPNTEKDTAYFCGTHSARKNPKHFIEFCKLYNKKALVITNAKGKEFFDEEFTKLGIDHDVRYNIFGQEKVDFIARGEVAFHPSECELFSYGVLEALHFMPVIVYDKCSWTKRLEPNRLIRIKNLKSWDGVIPDIKENREWVIDYFNEEIQRNMWKSYIDKNQITLDKTRSNSLEDLEKYIEENQSISVYEIWQSIIARKTVAYVDALALYKLANEFKIIQTADQTLLESK